jgi:hypothetical protein
MTITAKPKGSVAAPNSLTSESSGSVAVPNSLTSESVGSVAAPNSLTSESVGSVAVPNSLTAESVGSVAVPNSLTTESVGSVAVPNSLTSESAGSVAIPNSLTAQSVSAALRTLTPKVDMHFAGESYAQNGNPIAFDDLFTYARASSATFMNRRIVNNKYEYFLDTDYVGSVTNLLTYSEQFDNADWTKTNSSVTATAAKDPSGADVYRLADNSTSGAHRASSQVVTVSSGAKVTLSVRAKKASLNKIGLFEIKSLDGVLFDLSTGVIVSTSGTPNEYSIKSVGDGWFDCSVTVTVPATTAEAAIYTDSLGSYVGDGSYILVTRAQLTESAKPLPYAKTLSTSASETFSESIRIAYDPATGESLGAQIEGSSTNLVTYSEEFDNAAWIKSNSTVTANQQKALDDSYSMDKIAASSTASLSPSLSKSITATISEIYTASFFVKASEASFVQIFWGSSDVTDNPRANFDIANGVLGTVDSGVDANIEYYDNGIYRVSATVTAEATSFQAYFAIIGSATDTRAQSNAWTSGDGLYIWGAQLEAKPSATSYIHTEGSTVTRSADNLSVSDSNIPAINNKNTIAGKFRLQKNLNDSENRYYFNHGSTSASSRFLASIGDGNIGHRYSTLTGFDLSAENEADVFVAMTFDGASATQYKDDIVDLFGSNPSVIVESSTFYIGSRNGSVNFSDSFIKSITIFDEALTAAEIARL